MTRINPQKYIPQYAPGRSSKSDQRAAITRGKIKNLALTKRSLMRLKNLTGKRVGNTAHLNTQIRKLDMLVKRLATNGMNYHAAPSGTAGVRKQQGNRTGSRKSIMHSRPVAKPKMLPLSRQAVQRTHEELDKLDAMVRKAQDQEAARRKEQAMLSQLDALDDELDGEDPALDAILAGATETKSFSV